MAKDNEREAFSRTGLRETDLCQAAREIAGDTLDDGDAILAAVRSDRGLFALTKRALLLMDESVWKLLQDWPLAEMQDISVESRGGSGWLDWRTSHGADKESLVGDWSLFQQAVEAYLGGGAWREVERESQGEVESVLWKGKGLYLGGHPMFVKSEKAEGSLVLTEQALQYSGGTVTIRLLVSDIIDVRLGTYQPGPLRRILAGDSRVLADVRNTLLVDFDNRGATHKVEFEIRGAFTLSGNADKARELLNTLSSVKARFYQPLDGTDRTEESKSTAAADTATRLSVTNRLRELKQLLDEELINETDYEEKKAELLRNF